MTSGALRCVAEIAPAHPREGELTPSSRMMPIAVTPLMCALGRRSVGASGQERRASCEHSKAAGQPRGQHPGQAG
jgi:hypothetical protein